MNRLPLEKQVQIINMLVEGSSLRSTSRVCDVSINTVTKLLVDVGRACEQFHDETVRKVEVKRLQCDEIWSFVYSKEKNVPEGMEGADGDVWTWTALDADSKLMVSWFVGSLVFHIGKTRPLKGDGLCCSAAVIKRYLSETQTAAVDLKGCIAIDVFAGSSECAPSAIVGLMKDIEASCEDIARSWADA